MKLAERKIEKPKETKGWSRPPRRTEWSTISIFLAVASVLLFAELVARFLVFIDPPVLTGNQIFEEKYYVLQSVKPKTPVIFCLGDSMMSRAIYPDLLKSLLEEQGINVEVVNLAVDGSSTDVAKKFLQLALKRHVEPSLVLCNLPVTCLSGTSQAKPTKISLPVAEPPDELEDPKFLHNTYLGRSLLENPNFGDRLNVLVESESAIIRNRGYFKSRIKEFIGSIFNFPYFESRSRKPVGNYFPLVSYRGWNPNHGMLNAED